MKNRARGLARFEEHHAPCAGITRVRFDGLPAAAAAGSQRKAPLAVLFHDTAAGKALSNPRVLYLPWRGGVDFSQ
jgi:hypothetical protein